MIRDRLQAPSYLSNADYYRKIKARKQGTDIGKYYIVNRSITDWNRLAEGAIGSSNGITRVRKVKTSDGK